MHMVELDELIAKADFISLHIPLTESTHHLLDAEMLGKMKRGIRIVDCARGGVIDEDALYDAIVAGQVAGAALDVFESEPLTNRKLFELSQVIGSPHVGASTQRSHRPHRRRSGRSADDGQPGVLPVAGSRSATRGLRVADSARRGSTLTMTTESAIGVRIPKILLPKPGSDLSKWAVIACDQFTSEPRINQLSGKPYRPCLKIVHRVMLFQDLSDPRLSDWSDRMPAYSPEIEQTMQKYYATLSEKDRRRYAAIEALKLQLAEQSYIAQVLGCSEKTVRRGLADLAALPRSRSMSPLCASRAAGASGMPTPIRTSTLSFWPCCKSIRRATRWTTKSCGRT